MDSRLYSGGDSGCALGEVKLMTIREFIEILKKYPKYYKLYDGSSENGTITVRDENGKNVAFLFLDEVLPRE